MRELTSSLEMPVAYATDLGAQVVGDSRELLRQLPAGSVDLIVTSPPFALLREKEYGNESQRSYVSWLLEFGKAAWDPLKDTGSFVLDLGGAYRRGAPVRSLYNYRVLLEFVDSLGYHLAEEFFWYNPSKLPSPIEWVNKRKIRATDAVNTVWWLSKTEWPKADATRVRQPYSRNMQRLLKAPEDYYTAAGRPSQHSISKGFGTDNGGALPKNLLTIPNTESNSHYLRTCKRMGRRSHPARFPTRLPAFFIEFLSDPGDLVVDVFSGSNTTGHVSEQMQRRWLSCELDPDYAALSMVRFLEGHDLDNIEKLVRRASTGETVRV